jgi:hypothetical protein
VHKNDIISMAREAGWQYADGDDGYSPLWKFAALVAEAEREAIKWNSIHSCHDDCQNPACVIVREAVEAEREACAKVCDDIDNEYEGEDVLAAWCAAAIRARGNNG